jgi:primosomal protein N' (replication factor Y) (superfamily II helicase)
VPAVEQCDVRPARAGGAVVVLAEGSLQPVQAQVRWDAVTFAERELADRSALGFPPAARVAALTGPEAAVLDLLACADLPSNAQVLGPVPLPARSPAPAEEGEPPLARALVRTRRPTAWRSPARSGPRTGSRRPQVRGSGPRRDRSARTRLTLA